MRLTLALALTLTLTRSLCLTLSLSLALALALSRWGTFLSVMLWNTSGYDAVGALAAEVHEPGRDFPLAMMATIALVSLVYILPLGVAISLDRHRSGEDWDEWTDGHFARIAADHVGTTSR